MKKRPFPSAEGPPPGVDDGYWAALDDESREEVAKHLANNAKPPTGSTNSSSSSSSPAGKQKQSRLFAQSVSTSLSLPEASIATGSSSSGCSAHTALFTDPHFPAGPSAIDGIAATPTDTSIRRLCKCNKHAVIKLCRKEGPNRGRYFAVCPTLPSSTRIRPVLIKPSGRTPNSTIPAGIPNPTDPCDYFYWVNENPQEHKEEAVAKVWMRFGLEQGYRFVNSGYLATDIQQGSVGDCWFLSAIAVVAERADVMDKISPSRVLDPTGRHAFRLFIDGAWQEIVVDNFLPCLDPMAKLPSKLSPSKIKALGDFTLCFSKNRSHQLWVPLLEKAYAKAHGSYAAISGGEISEALLDLTGCPIEAIEFDSEGFSSEQTWAKLLSYRLAGFPMGAATSTSGQGIVGHHAYSVLEVREVDCKEVGLGEQTNITSFFSSSSNINSSSSSTSSLARLQKISELTTDTGLLRMIRLRNPWGRVEWTGEFSHKSEMWSRAMAQLLEKGNKNDGCFWMTYHDFLRRFSRIDVCKAHKNELNSGQGEGWQQRCIEGYVCLGQLGGGESTFVLTVRGRVNSSLLIGELCAYHF